jgi:hypothetical protein
VSDIKHKARRSALKKFRDVMDKLSGEDRDDPSKPSGITAQVSAKDPESLKEGLETAAEFVDDPEKFEDEVESGPNYDDMSRDELLEALKSKG